MGLCLGLALARVAASSTRTSWVWFGVLTAVHLFACRCGLRLLSLPHVTLHRLDSILVPQPGRSAALRSRADRIMPVDSAIAEFGHVRADLPTPSLVAKAERVVAMPTPLGLDRARVRLGVPVKELMARSATDVGSLDDELLDVFRDEPFIACANWRGSSRNRAVLVKVSLKTQLEGEGADSKQAFRAAVFACVLRRRLRASSQPALSRVAFRDEVRTALGEYRAVFLPLCDSFCASSWTVDEPRLVTQGYRVMVDEYATYAS
mmetsp:Transcript_38003/g.65578  ORF Transcript_38003/g.65578 Transcript_38003/m.65578 type:complete len:263 (+) Transcript_38003:207-995(+)